jgi:hypothetical protein
MPLLIEQDPTNSASFVRYGAVAIELAGQTRAHGVAREGSEMDMDDLWLPTLKTDTPQEGIELAVKLSDLGFMLCQSSDESCQASRATDKYTRSQLIAAAHVIALNFQTVAAANDWWRHRTSQNGD